MKTSAPRVLVAVVVALSILVPSWGATAHAAGLPVPAGFEVTTRRDVSPGVEHLTLTRRQTPLVMNVARIARSAPVDLQIVSAFDKVGPRKNEESLEHPSAMCARVGCVVGVNGDFYHPDTEEPFGAVATDGRLLRSPAPGRGQGWQTRDGNFAVGMLPWSGSVAPAQGGAIPIAGVNVDPVPGAVVLYTPEYGPSTRARTTELIVRLGRSPVLGQAVSVELMRMGDGYTPIPADGAVLAGDGGAADALRDLWNRRATAGPITLRLDADVVETIGIYPILVTGGRSVAPTPLVRDDLVTGRHSRTLIGRTADGSLLLVTIDSRWSGVSEGVSTTDAANLLLALGVVEGGNLDGGGGSTFVVQGKVANRPSDGPNSPAAEPDGPVLPHEYAPGLFERTAVNMIAIVPRAIAPGGGTGSGSGGGQTGGGGATGGQVPGGGLFAPTNPGTLFGTSPAGGGPSGATSLFAPSPLDSTPLASASALFKVFSLVKAKAAANAQAAASAPGAAVEESTTTTSGKADPTTAAAGAGESAAGIAPDGSLPAPSRLPAVMVSVMLILSMLGALASVHQSRAALVRVVVRSRPPAGDGLLHERSVS